MTTPSTFRNLTTPDEKWVPLKVLKQIKTNPAYIKIYKQTAAMLRRQNRTAELHKNDVTAKVHAIREYHLFLWTELGRHHDELDYGPLIRAWNMTVDDMVEAGVLYEDTAHLLYIDPGIPDYS